MSNAVSASAEAPGDVLYPGVPVVFRVEAKGARPDGGVDVSFIASAAGSPIISGSASSRPQ